MKSYNSRYNLIAKRVRAIIIKNHLKEIGTNQCVCFTSGNSGKFLELQNVSVTKIVKPEKWYSFTEISKKYKLFDATSGHLPFPIMTKISEVLKVMMRDEFKKGKKYSIPTGSGETIILLKMAFPQINFQPIRIKNFPPTQYHKEAPLNSLLVALFPDISKTQHL